MISDQLAMQIKALVERCGGDESKAAQWLESGIEQIDVQVLRRQLLDSFCSNAEDNVVSAREHETGVSLADYEFANYSQDRLESGKFDPRCRQPMLEDSGVPVALRNFVPLRFTP